MIFHTIYKDGILQQSIKKQKFEYKKIINEIQKVKNNLLEQEKKVKELKER